MNRKSVGAGSTLTEVRVPAPKRALVLSAGGMFGAYQAGVWDELCHWYRPDVVVGASIGSLNGYLIACGTAPEKLVTRWRSLDAIERIRWRMSARLDRGLIDNTTVEDWIRELLDNGTPGCEYGLVATETLSMKQRLFQWPDLTWQHMAASCGVPVFLPTYRIHGVRYSDGGLVDPLPLWAAIHMGATEIVSVDLLHRRPLPVRAAVRCLQYLAGYKRPRPETVRWFQINPSGPLGKARDAMYWNRENTERWIELGRRDTRAVKSEFLGGDCGPSCNTISVECFERLGS